MKSILHDPWVVFGFAAQIVFFSRFILQWYRSEKAGKTVIPLSFWYLSIVGGVMILSYAIKKQDVVFIFGQAAALLIYTRNLQIAFLPSALPKGSTLKDTTTPASEHTQSIFRKGWVVLPIVSALILSAVFPFALRWGAETLTLASPPIFAEREMLEGLWNSYKNDYLEEETFRTVDRQRNDITTSEGQSYTMLRAVWIDDRETFDHSWQWTKDNLQRKEDYLMSWIFGERSDGSYGILDTPGAENTATDSDSDIALALLLAYARWRHDGYYFDALPIINSIWEKTVVIINDEPHLAANNVEKTSGSDAILVNPSYFSPYTYRIFAAVDQEHDWLSLIDTSYDIIKRSMKLGGSDGLAMPPDWVLIDKMTGALKEPPGGTIAMNYSFDAMRTPWRLALDWQWYGEPRAKELLEDMVFLTETWLAHDQLHASYTNQGSILYSGESAAMYGTSIGHFLVTNPELAEDLYTRKLISLYNKDTFSWNQPLSYYETNWAWFGIALYNEMLENYTEIPNLAL